MADDTQTRNGEALASFVEYCQQNPKQRFWQALRNWSGYEHVFVASALYAKDETNNWKLPHGTPLTDTFYLEGDGEHVHTKAEEIRYATNGLYLSNYSYLGMTVPKAYEHPTIEDFTRTSRSSMCSRLAWDAAILGIDLRKEQDANK